MLFRDDDASAAPGGPLERLRDPTFADESAAFSDQSHVQFSKQFAPIYASRLEQMRELLTLKCQAKWGSQYPIKRLFELDEDHPQQCIVIGTLYKHQSLKPSILRELSEETQLAPQPARFQFAADDDQLILEDELQRIRLVGDVLDVHRLVTGVVCAVLGYEHCDGKLHVVEALFYESGPQPTIPAAADAADARAPLLVLVSGLDLSAPDNDSALPLELLQQWLFGNLNLGGGDATDANDDWEAARIVRCIVAGNSVRSAPERRQRSNQLRQPESLETLRAVCAVDAILAGWVRAVPVDLMPGEFDPTNYMLPQQPMHPCLWPQCRRSAHFRCVTNPYACRMAGGRRVLGTAGQNVADVQRYTRIARPLEALRECLRWAHVAPTAPDTLPCYPYAERDPFVMREAPAVFFAGNAERFETEVAVGAEGQRTRLVCVPRFAVGKSVAVVNLRTLACKEMRFSVGKVEE